MGVLGRLRISFWLIIAGSIVLYAFFVALASIPPAQVAGVTAVVATMAIVFIARNLRVANELADPGGDPQLRRSRNRMRERRGF
jgi:flagellar motor protein MotB